MGGRAARARAVQLLEEFDLGDRRKAHVHELSGGQAKRLMIARALVQRPQVLFLDEPTAGIDPQTRLHLWDLLRRLHAEGLTILLTTHYLEEAESLCERIAVLDHGQVLACGTMPELIASQGVDTIMTVSYDGTPPSALRKLAGQDGIRRVEITGDRARVFARDAGGLLGAVVRAGGCGWRAGVRCHHGAAKPGERVHHPDRKGLPRMTAVTLAPAPGEAPCPATARHPATAPGPASATHPRSGARSARW